MKYNHLKRLQEEISLHATLGIADYQGYSDQLIDFLERESEFNWERAWNLIEELKLNLVSMANTEDITEEPLGARLV